MVRRLTALFFFLLLTLVCAGFVRLNALPTRVELYVGQVPATVGEVAVGAFLTGWGVALIGAVVWNRRLARERLRLARELKVADGEVRHLRAQAPGHAL
jgi:uncharacterized integral membrane protein